MATNNNTNSFLINFKQSLTELEKINTSIGIASNKNKTNTDIFIQNVSTGLGEIHEQIKSLESLIDNVNSKLKSLQSKCDNNDNLIYTHTSEKNALLEQLKTLQDSEILLKQQLTDHNSVVKKAQDLQKDIEMKEAAIAKLNADNKSIQSALEKLKITIAQEGSEKEKQTAGIIEKLKSDNLKAINEFKVKEEANIQQVNKLKVDVETKNDDLRKLKSQYDLIVQQLTECKSAQPTILNQITQKNAEIERLRQLNKQYEDEIKKATITIDKVVKSLNELLTKIPTIDNPSQLDGTFKDIKTTIEKLSTILKQSQQTQQTQQTPQTQRFVQNKVNAIEEKNPTPPNQNFNVNGRKWFGGKKRKSKKHKFMKKLKQTKQTKQTKKRYSMNKKGGYIWSNKNSTNSFKNNHSSLSNSSILFKRNKGRGITKRTKTTKTKRRTL